MAAPERVDHEPVETDVLGNAQIGKQREVLPDHVDAVALGFLREDTGCGRFAVKGDLGAGFGDVHPIDDLDQRAFPASVLSGKAMHLAFFELEGHVFQRRERSEFLRDTRRAYCVLCHNDPLPDEPTSGANPA